MVYFALNCISITTYWKKSLSEIFENIVWKLSFSKISVLILNSYSNKSYNYRQENIFFLSLLSRVRQYFLLVGSEERCHVMTLATTLYVHIMYQVCGILKQSCLPSCLRGFTNYVLYFLLHFDHPPTYCYILAKLVPRN